jgi:glutamyl-tRNA synthetase
MSVRVRFPPSPTGDLHVGNVRSALFNWAYARHTGGTFILRIEDTDRARSTEQSYRGLLDDLRWLGLTWDEGPEVGGPHAPYRQSERLDLYADVAARLVASGAAYRCYCTPEEVAARNAAAGRPPGYDGYCRSLTEAQLTTFEAEGRAPVLRLRMPGVPIEFDDLIRGPVRFEPEHVPDFVLVRADGFPLYTLTNPVDDALMGITHVLRGEDLLSSTPRQIALYDALRVAGVFAGPTPSFGHLPFVLGEGNAKLSKRRTPEASLAYLREQGFLPEAVVNYLALLGWSIGGDRELFTLDEMAASFTLDRVSRNPARFDVKKLTAINGVKIRGLPAAEFVRRIVPFLAAAKLVADPPTPDQAAVLAAARPLIQERMSLLAEAVDLLWFLLVDESEFGVDDVAAGKELKPASAPVLESAVSALEKVGDWTTSQIQAAIDGALVDGLGLGRRKAYGALRVAVTGRTISPPLPESMELLGRERTLHRLRSARDRILDGDSGVG